MRYLQGISDFAIYVIIKITQLWFRFEIFIILQLKVQARNQQPI